MVMMMLLMSDDSTLSPPIQPKKLDPSLTTGSTLSDLWLPFDLLVILISSVLC